MTVLNARADTVVGTTNVDWVGPGNAVDGAYGTVPATFFTWQNAVANAVGTVDLGFGTQLSVGIPADSTVSGIQVSVNHKSHATRIIGITMALFDGATAIGTPQACVVANTAHVDTFTFTPTAAQVRSSAFVVRLAATRLNGTSSSGYDVDHVDVAVTYEAAIEPPEPPEAGSGMSVTVAGVLMDPCHTLAQVSVMHGRGGFGETGQPSSATVVIEHPVGSMPTWQSGDTLLLTHPQGPLFSGRIVQRSLSHIDDSDGTRWGQFTVTAAGALAALGARKIGEEPWPQEYATQRAARILSAAGTPWDVEGTMDLHVLPRDVDAQPADGLLDELVDWTSAAVFDTPSGEVVYQTLASRSRTHPYMWSDFDAALMWSEFDPLLTWDGAAPSMGDWLSPLTEFPTVLPCTAVEWEPEWTSSEALVINHVRVSYGIAEPQDAVDLTQDASITRHGERYRYLGTQLASVDDALERASQIISTQAVERWEIGDVIVALDQLDPATYTAVLGLICGDQVTLQGLPQPAPAIDWTGIVEGWTFTQWGKGGVLQERLTLTLSDPLLSLVVMIWDDYPSLYTWLDHPSTITWDDLESTGILEAAA